MRKLMVGVLLTATLGAAAAWGAVQDLPSSVLALLTRNNYWSGVNTYSRSVGVALERGNVLQTGCADRFSNLGGNLYFNCALVTPTAGAGTVTSVGLSAPNIFTVSGSPVVSSGTLTLTAASQAANTVWAGPQSGSPGTPAFRALVDNDIPDGITINSTGTVTWNSVSKTGSSLGDLITRSATDLTSGTLQDGVFPAVLPAISGANLTNLAAGAITTGTLACARLPALTGDVTTSACAATLANTAVTPSTYGDGTHSVTIAIDSKGRITAASQTSITPGGTTGVANGGTGITSYAIGDLLYATASTTLSKLADVAPGSAVISGGIGIAPSFGKIGLTTHVSGILPIANGGTALSTAPSNGQLLIGNGSAYALATLTGTANQITVTNGAGTITLATPQAIATTSLPQFACVGLGTGCTGSEVLHYSGQPNLGLVADGNCGAAQTINFNLSVIHTSTLSAASCTYTFTNPLAGSTYTVVVAQDGTGGRIVVWPGTVVWFGGPAPILSPTPNAIDVCRFTYTGTSYLGSCQLATGAGEVHTTTLVLTDTQIKALPTTGVTALSATGPNTFVKVLGVTYVLNAAAGAYTNLNGTYVDLHLELDTYYASYGPVNDSTTTPALTLITQTLGAAGSSIYEVGQPNQFAITGAPGYVLSSTVAGTGPVNKPLLVKSDNNGSGNFTGGNAANTMRVIITYIVVPTS
jgi:hypothetical protein